MWTTLRPIFRFDHEIYIMKLAVLEIDGRYITFANESISGRGSWQGDLPPVQGTHCEVDLELPRALVWGETVGAGDAPADQAVWYAQVEGELADGVLPLKIGSAICLVEIEAQDVFTIGERVWLIPSEIELYPISY
jgi:hypothetical protein